MLINDVMKSTGLTKKAIYFYEDKRLLSVQRQINGYRSYSDDNILTLKKIKLLRSCGVSVSDIKLLFSNMITIEDLLKKREKEIENEYGNFSSLFSNVLSSFNNFKKNQYDLDIQFDEITDITPAMSDKISLGLDIGTTSISASVIDTENKSTVESFTIDNASDIHTTKASFMEQSPYIIYNKIIKLVELIAMNYPQIKTIGVTGQMHGIMYVNKDGNAVSELITWQDKRADELLDGGESYSERIYKVTGKRVPSGFGFATHYYNILNGLVPADAHSFCSIMDYIVMKLTCRPFPLIHSSVAASFGLFDIKSAIFDKKSISALGMNDIFLPEVTDKFAIAGNYKGIPVSVAIGDNQASFIGSVENVDETILVNIGTGSQISFSADLGSADGQVEFRPLFKNKFILCGSALCGGSSYALLECFFRSYIKAANFDCRSQYDVLNQLASSAYADKKEPLTVNTAFCGTRSDPNLKGAILNITRENFTPEQLVLGFIFGICRELHDFLQITSERKMSIVASGNAVRRIPIMKQIIEDVFGLPVKLSDNEEEASVGAALFSARAANI